MKTHPCAARSTLVYLERGGDPRCTKGVKSVTQASWRREWCPGEVLDPSHNQRDIILNAWCEYYIFETTQCRTVSGLDDGKRKTERGWSPGDSLNLVRVLSVRVNYSQQCRNDINGRWEYSKSIMIFLFLVKTDEILQTAVLNFYIWIKFHEYYSFLRV